MVEPNSDYRTLSVVQLRLRGFVDEIDTMQVRYTKEQLLGEVSSAWAELSAALDRLTPEQMTEIRDHEGWSVKDHVVHMAAWERSVAVYLQGFPRAAGLGIDEELYQNGEEDDINAAIQARWQGISPDEALDELKATHQLLLTLLEPMSDDDINRPNSDFGPRSEGEPDTRPICGMIYSNSANHFREHQGWIESLVSDT